MAASGLRSSWLTVPGYLTQDADTLLRGLVQLEHHAGEGARQFADLVAAGLQLDRRGLALADPRGLVAQAQHRVGDAVGNEARGDERGGDGQCREDDDEIEAAPDQRLHGLVMPGELRGFVRERGGDRACERPVRHVGLFVGQQQLADRIAVGAQDGRDALRRRQ
jgi:hypothetical protein